MPNRSSERKDENNQIRIKIHDRLVSIINEYIQKILLEVKSRLKEIYSEDLVDVILFGSQARDQADQGSDIDIAVILNREVNKYEEIGPIVDAIYYISLQNDELISILPMSLNEYINGNYSIHENIRREGVVV